MAISSTTAKSRSTPVTYWKAFVWNVSTYVHSWARVSRVCNYHNREGFFVSHFLHFSDLMHSYKSITHTNNNFITLAVAAPLCFLTNTKGPGKPPDQFIICHALCQHRDWTKRNVKKKKRYNVAKVGSKVVTTVGYDCERLLCDLQSVPCEHLSKPSCYHRQNKTTSRDDSGAFFTDQLCMC